MKLSDINKTFVDISNGQKFELVSNYILCKMFGVEIRVIASVLRVNPHTNSKITEILRIAAFIIL